ncbi:MAG: class I SAM-dependent methyltransferase [Anaerolineae bacterium]|nr:class I SAM-dependent methyltransferase [Anaerolineae bacterium]
MRDEFPGLERDPNTRQFLNHAAAWHIRAVIHEVYETPRVDFARWALSRVKWRGDEVVLDTGFGAGAYLEALQARAPRGMLVAGDLSLSLLDTTVQRAEARGAPLVLPPLLLLDVPALPFPDGTFDVVLAGHNLDHVPDIDGALAELHRVLRPTGVLLAATNSMGHSAELDVLYRRACSFLGVPDSSMPAVGPGAAYPPPPERALYLENGVPLLARHFAAVARYDRPSSLVFPDVLSGLTYLESLRPIHEPALPPTVSWPALMEVMESLLGQVINHFGGLVVSKLPGVLVATDAGDFAAPYAPRLVPRGGN